MTEQEREELIEKIAERIDEMLLFGSTSADIARAVLAVAEPVIREQCAEMAEKRACMIDCCEATGVKIATAIREGGEND